METSVSETTVPLARYSAEALDEKIPTKKSLDKLSSTATTMVAAGITLNAFYCVWGLIYIGTELWWPTTTYAASLLKQPFVVNAPLSLLFAGIIVALPGMLLMSYTESRLNKFHKIVHQGEVFDAELVQETNEPLTQVYTVRGYTLGGDLVFYTSSHEVDPVNPVIYEVGDLLDKRNDKLRAASLEA